MKERVSLIKDLFVGLDMSEGFYGDQTIEWHLFDLEKEPVNIEGEGESHLGAVRWFRHGRGVLWRPDH